MAGLSIYQILNWQQNTSYNLYDIYIYNNLYYYANRNHNSGYSFNSNYSNGVLSFNGINKPNFFWKPSYNSNISVKPMIRKTQFGDGYSQVTPDGINNILLPFNLIFDKRSDAHARSIIHFLTVRKGAESFVYSPPFPFNINKLFRCEEFTHTAVFSDNNTVTATFIETPV
jgi:phage-related protein